MRPLRFTPQLKSLIWGGEKIAPYKGIRTGGRNIGESWELSGVAGNESVVAEGEYAGPASAASWSAKPSTNVMERNSPCW